MYNGQSQVYCDLISLSSTVSHIIMPLRFFECEIVLIFFTNQLKQCFEYTQHMFWLRNKINNFAISQITNLTPE